MDVRVLHVDGTADGEPVHTQLAARYPDLDIVHVAAEADAIELLDRERFDAVVTGHDDAFDCRTLVAAVRERDADIPIICFTSRGSEALAETLVGLGVTGYLRQDGPERLDALVERLHDAVRSNRARGHAADLSRITDLIRRVQQVVVYAESREALERRVCELLTDSEPYQFAWFGEADATGEKLVPRVSAGDDAGYLDRVTIRLDESPRGQGPGGRAYRTRRVQVASDLQTDPRFAPWTDAVDEYGYRSVIVLPILHDDELYSLLAIYADRPNAFDARERAVLTELAETIGYAIDALETEADLRERTDELARQNDRLARIIGIIAHDFRNPLAVARGRLTLAKHAAVTDEDPEEAVEHVIAADAALERLGDLIDGLLALAQGGEAARVPCSLDVLVREAWADQNIEGAYLDVVADLPTVEGDPARLRSLFGNLFSNAVRHAGPEPRVEVGTLPDGFYVADDGPGIPDDLRERVLDYGYTTSSEGIGLGLAIVHEVAIAHGWTLSLTESDSGGARFEFRWDSNGFASE
ncbi:GAF domain-containing protein [Natronomonas sp. EA1]|uniref:GAF domain-containing sensor histidine kinase n=1 Tax=Natronomonas sp. EA1 TaxID=3421655 RepID=UPI003EC1220D